MDLMPDADLVKYGALGLDFACILVFGVTVRSMIAMPQGNFVAARTVLLAVKIIVDGGVCGEEPLG